MEKTFLLYYVALITIIPLLFALAGYNTALRKNRTPLRWAFICWASGLIGYIVLASSKTLEKDEDLDCPIENDNLGGAMLFFAILWCGFAFYIDNGQTFEIIRKALAYI